MSRNSAGSYSLPSGNPVVTGTTVSSSWANSTLTDIGTELTNSLDRNGRGAMLAALPLSDGSAAAPGLTFAAEAGSGLYRAGTNDVRLQVAGVQRLQATAAGIVIGTLSAGALTSTSSLSATGANSASSTTAATTTVRQDALALPNGDLKLDGVANPASTVALKNRLTPKNICKAWGVASYNGSGWSLVDGFNVASVAKDGVTIGVIVTLAQAFASSAYAIVAMADLTGGVSAVNEAITVASRAAGSFELMWGAGGSTPTGAIIHFMAFGAQ